MGNPDSSGGFQKPQQLAYPSDSDSTVREYASYPLIGNHSVIDMLDQIREKVTGNQDKVFNLANNWELNPLNDSLTNLQTVTNQLTPEWTGKAANAFSTFSSSMLGAIKDDRAAMQAMGKTLANCGTQVYITYGNMINEIGGCAAKLVKIGLEAILTDGLALVQVGDILETFLKAEADFLANAEKQIGTYTEDGVGFKAAVNQCTVFAEPDSLMKDPKQWTEVPDK